MAFNFPTSPAIGENYPTSPVTSLPVYIWDSEKWTYVTPVLLAPTLALHVDSDSGTVGDNVTEDSTPKLTITLDAFVENDHILLYTGSTLIIDHVVTLLEAGGAAIDIVATALALGIHLMRARRVSGANFSSFGPVLVLTVVAPTAGASADYTATYISSGAF